MSFLVCFRKIQYRNNKQEKKTDVNFSDTASCRMGGQVQQAISNTLHFKNGLYITWFCKEQTSPIDCTVIYAWAQGIVYAFGTQSESSFFIIPLVIIFYAILNAIFNGILWKQFIFILAYSNIWPNKQCYVLGLGSAAFSLTDTL